MAGQIEFKKKDLYLTHKRNLLLLCSAVVVVALSSNPEAQIPVPLLGPAVKISKPVAFLFSMLAASYFLWEFWVEWSVARALNSESLAGTSKEDLDTSLRAIVDQIGQESASVSSITAQIDSVATIMMQMNNRLVGEVRDKTQQIGEVVKSTFVEQFRLLPTPPPPDPEIPHPTAEEVLFQKLSQLDQQLIDQINFPVEGLRIALETVNSLGASLHARSLEVWQELSAAMSKRDAAFETLRGDITRISSSISLSQRINFRADLIICGAMFGAAAAASLWACWTVL